MRPSLADRAELTRWLRRAILAGQVGGPWGGEFPRSVWTVRENGCDEGRLVNQQLGQYKGYPRLGRLGVRDRRLVGPRAPGSAVPGVDRRAGGDRAGAGVADRAQPRRAGAGQPAAWSDPP